MARRLTADEATELLVEVGERGADASVEEVRAAISALPAYFTGVMLDQGFDPGPVKALCTKLRDAGRRSPPWRPASGRVPGRPQDGADGNRRLRWLFEPDHKFWADEKTASLVEVRYYMQLLSMDGAPGLPDGLEGAFEWLTGHPVGAGEYRDPIQLVGISLPEVIEDPRRIQSGHLVPLDRGGKHTPENAFLMLARSNKLQGNLTLDELLELMETILQRHAEQGGPQEPTVDLSD